MKRQAEREGGRILTLQERNAAGNTSLGLSSVGKGSTSPSNMQKDDGESFGGATEEYVKLRLRSVW